MRKSIAFWLDSRKPAQADLLQYVSELKAAREFSSAIRDGLRLVRDLRAGNLDVLFELFPWIERALYDALEASQKPSGGESGGEQVSMAELKALLIEVKAAQQPGAHYQAPALASGNLSGLKPMAGSGQALPGPSDHDDLGDLLKVKNASDTPRNDGKPSAAENFINSMLAMQKSKPEARTTQ